MLNEYFCNVQEKQLRSELSFAISAVETNGIDYLKKLDKAEERLTLIENDGQVIYDTWIGAETLENHLNREEIKEAIENGRGESSRYSDTFTEETIYYASKISDGKILRISTSRMTMLSLFLSMLQPIFTVIIVALILSFLLASRISKQISEPLNNLDLDNPLENNTYDEIAPLLTKIERGQREILKKKKELEKSKEEFEAVTSNMNEGLVIINSEYEIVYINSAAQKFYDNEDNLTGSKFQLLDRDSETAKMLEEAVNNGSAERIKENSGREYQLHAGNIKSNGEDAGIVLIIFDITEKAFAERNRREFTANVSHELKSPLHSIMGSAELLENGLVNEEDKIKFIGVIRNEASRLVSLIDDIIRLSELDEKSEIEFEKIDLREFVLSEVELLKSEAVRKEISILTECDNVKCKTSKQLLHEIVYNLMDNAIKYNKYGGDILVKTSSDENTGYIIVKDTGIGISQEHKDRVFERFYRIDKSHSRDSGGTGLGLSIVKHAVQYIGASIELDSEEDVGTTVTVGIPL